MQYDINAWFVWKVRREDYEASDLEVIDDFDTCKGGL
jgi:hypothetical protein